MSYYICYGADFNTTEEQSNYTPMLFFDRKDAIECLKDMISHLENNGYVIDSDFDESVYDDQDYIECICFYGYQENWRNYSEFYISTIDPM